MEKTISLIEGWIGDISQNDRSDHPVSQLGASQDKILHAIFTLCEERSRFQHVFEDTMRHLSNLACNKERYIREFVLVCAPTLLYIYLSSVSMGDKKGVASVEVVLLSLYNMEVLDELGQPRISAFRLPTLARHSNYHDPASLAPASFSQDSLHRLEAADTKTIQYGPSKEMSNVTASNRDHLATALLVTFNASISKWSKLVLMQLCKVASKFVCQGFSKPGHHQRSSYGNESSFSVYPRPIPRIPVSSDLLSEFTHAIYFSMFNECSSLGIQAIEDIHLRAQYELFADVLLMTNAIKNSIEINSSGQLSDELMGINVITMPSTMSSPLSKSFITNASFRTKKLPDDIEPRDSDGNPNPLGSISEEGGDGMDKDKDGNKPIRPLQGSGRENKLRLPGNIPLVKKRDKNKNGDKKDNEKKFDKKKDRDSKIDGNSNRNSGTGIMNSDSDEMSQQYVPQYIQREHLANKQRNSLQQQIEMAPMENMTLSEKMLLGEKTGLLDKMKISERLSGGDAPRNSLHHITSSDVTLTSSKQSLSENSDSQIHLER